jgi:hypothetical protein
VELSKLAGATPSSAADDRDRLRLEHTQRLAILDAKYTVIKALRSLHQELVRCLPFPTEDSDGI